MEERAEYYASGRPGKRFVGGYLDVAAAERLRKAADLKDMSMTDLLEWLATRLDATFVPEGCACGHE